MKILKVIGLTKDKSPSDPIYNTAMFQVNYPHGVQVDDRVSVRTDNGLYSGEFVVDYIYDNPVAGISNIYCFDVDFIGSDTGELLISNSEKVEEIFNVYEKSAQMIKQTLIDPAKTDEVFKVGTAQEPIIQNQTTVKTMADTSTVVDDPIDESIFSKYPWLKWVLIGLGVLVLIRLFRRKN